MGAAHDCGRPGKWREAATWNSLTRLTADRFRLATTDTLGQCCFPPYAADIAARAKAFAPLAVLETAAGTGIATARLAEVLSDDAVVTATDLNQAMIDSSVAKITSPKVTWQICDATQLPFADGSFDLV